MTAQKTPLAAAIFASLYPASQAIAQESAPKVTGLEPVIVTATRRAEKLQEVPQSITALSTEFIQKQAIVNTPAQRSFCRGLPATENSASTARSRSTSTTSR